MIQRLRYRLARLIAPAEMLFNREMSLVLDRLQMEVESLRKKVGEE